MHEEREVRCRCGERIFTAPSLTVRCPQCGRRLFWKCQCGALVERVINKCPYCGTDHEKTRSEARPSLRLRKILGAGLIGAFVFTLLGYWLHKALPRLSLERASDLVSNSLHQNDNVVVLILKGILLLFADLVRAIGRIVYENPMFLVIPILGFLIAAVLAARQQKLTWRRLKRHLRRKWEQFTSR